MHVYVDADALPAPIRDILFRASQRLQFRLTLVANKYLSVPDSELITAVRVDKGFDVVDDAIVDMVGPGDLVITADIPLAAQVLDKGGHVISPRGQAMTRDDIKGRLAMRELLAELRDSGVQTGGPPPLSNRDRESFANRLDAFLREHAED